MLPDRVSNPGTLTYESGALPIALRGPAHPLSKELIPLRYRATSSGSTLFASSKLYFHFGTFRIRNCARKARSVAINIVLPFCLVMVKGTKILFHPYFSLVS